MNPILPTMIAAADVGRSKGFGQLKA